MYTGRYYIQGDIILRHVDKIPKDATPIPVQNGHYVVAEGELTGHAHVLTQNVKTVWDVKGQRYVELGGPSPMVHPQHDPQGSRIVEPGIIEVGHQREYADEGERPVAD